MEETVSRRKKYILHQQKTGLCIESGCKNFPEVGLGRCRLCLDGISMATRALYRNRADAGLCTRCGKTVPTSLSHKKSPLCEQHWFAERASDATGSRKDWKALRQILIDQEYKCPLSGRHLVIGKNAEVDHKMPVNRYGSHMEFSRNPEGNCIENLWWVDADVNWAKNNLSVSEFLDLVRQVYEKSISLLSQ